MRTGLSRWSSFRSCLKSPIQKPLNFLALDLEGSDLQDCGDLATLDAAALQVSRFCTLSPVFSIHPCHKSLLGAVGLLLSGRYMGS